MKVRELIEELKRKTKMLLFNFGMKKKVILT